MNGFRYTYNKNGVILRKLAINKSKTDLCEHEFLRGVSCFVTQGDNLIMGKRDSSRTDSTLLDICSGHVEGSEKPYEAIRRELSEEFGIDKTNSQAVNLLNTQLIAVPKGERKNYICSFHGLKIPKSCELKPQDNEVKEIILIPIDKALELIRENKRFRFACDDDLEKTLKAFENTL